MLVSYCCLLMQQMVELWKYFEKATDKIMLCPLKLKKLVQQLCGVKFYVPIWLKLQNGIFGLLFRF